MEVLKIKKLNPDAHIPTRAHPTDAGMDLYALPVEYTKGEKEIIKASLIGTAVMDSAETFNRFCAATDSDWEYMFKNGIVVLPHKTVMVPTGIAVSINPGYVGYVFARSGLASKQSLSPVNGVGVIDSAYRGEIKVPLHNHSDKIQIVDVGDRIAQLVIQPISLCQPVEVNKLDETDRGNAGFGSTGEK